MTFFRGYVPTKDKKCTMPFKGKPDSELRTYAQVKNLPEYAGILAEDTILIDIDDFEQSEILMKIQNAIVKFTLKNMKICSLWR